MRRLRLTRNIIRRVTHCNIGSKRACYPLRVTLNRLIHVIRGLDVIVKIAQPVLHISRQKVPTVYFTMGRPSPTKIAPSHERIWTSHLTHGSDPPPHLTPGSLGPLEYTYQTASRSAQPLFRPHCSTIRTQRRPIVMNRVEWPVCLSVSHSREPCHNSWV